MSTTIRLVVLMVCLVALAFQLPAQSQNGDQVRVLVGYDKRPGAAETGIVQSLGGSVKHVLESVPAVAARIPREAMPTMAKMPGVTVVEEDVPIQAIGEYDTVWGVRKIKADLVHATGNRGQGVKVCVIDTGVDYNHPDLSGNFEWTGSWDFVNNDNNPFDDNGHGTHVAGTVAAALNTTGVVGVAPQARIIAMKILNAAGSGYISDAIAAVDRCRQYGGLVTNNSYGTLGDPGSLVKAAFDSSYNLGVLHVAASGNASRGTCNSVAFPARYDSVIAVGATDSNDQIASFSCRGPQVELAAPGVSIQSTYPGGLFATGSGTSMASPHAAGTAALVFGCGLTDLNADGRVNNIDVRLRLQQTALDLGVAGRDTLYGFGRIRADLAATNCAGSPPPTPLPTAPGNLRVTGTSTSTISIAWNDSQHETSYEVEACSGTASGCANGVYTRVATLSANATTFTHAGLAPGTTRTYRVRAVNSTGPSGYSNTATGSTRQNTTSKTSR